MSVKMTDSLSLNFSKKYHGKGLDFESIDIEDTPVITRRRYADGFLSIISSFKQNRLRMNTEYIVDTCILQLAVKDSNVFLKLTVPHIGCVTYLEKVECDLISNDLRAYLHQCDLDMNSDLQPIVVRTVHD